MGKGINTRHTCKDCAFFNNGLCVKRNTATRAIYYACDKFKTFKEMAEEVERRKKEMLDREETRLNFLLTALYISATSTQILMEYFDAQFSDAKVERNWRFSRKRAANEITDAANRMRNLYQHTFMEDQTKVMTAHGTKAFDAQAYDYHEADARGWALNLLYHLDRCWQDDDAELQVLDYYKAMPDNGIFDKKDYDHFISRK
jgi:hypothetical protein